MTPEIHRRLYWLAPILLALGLSLSSAMTRPALAQEPEPAAGDGEKGRPLDGYLATGCLAGLALWAVAKSARR